MSEKRTENPMETSPHTGGAYVEKVDGKSSGDNTPPHNSEPNGTDTCIEEQNSNISAIENESSAGSSSECNGANADAQDCGSGGIGSTRWLSRAELDQSSTEKTDDSEAANNDSKSGRTDVAHSKIGGLNAQSQSNTPNGLNREKSITSLSRSRDVLLRKTSSLNVQSQSNTQELKREENTTSANGRDRDEQVGSGTTGNAFRGNHQEMREPVEPHIQVGREALVQKAAGRRVSSAGTEGAQRGKGNLKVPVRNAATRDGTPLMEGKQSCSPSPVHEKGTPSTRRLLTIGNQRLQRELQMEADMLAYEVESVLEAKSQAVCIRKKSLSTEDSVRHWQRKAEHQKRQVLLLREQCAKNKNIEKLVDLQNRIREKENMLVEMKVVSDGLDKIRAQQEKAMHRVKQKNQDLPDKVKQLQNELKLLKVSNAKLRQENLKNEQESKRLHEAAVDYEGNLRRYLKILATHNTQPSSPASRKRQPKVAPEKQQLLDTLAVDQERMQKEIEVLDRAKASDEKKYSHELGLVQQEIKALQAKVRGFQKGIQDAEAEIAEQSERLQEVKRLRAEYESSKASETSTRDGSKQ